MNQRERIVLDVSRKAFETRKKLGLGNHEPIDIFKILNEVCNVNILFRHFSKDVSGLFLRLPKVNLIAINSGKTLGHQRFTAAHEFYHLEYDTDITHSICRVGQYESGVLIERQADYFAASMLTPEEAVRYRLFERTSGVQVKMADVVDLEQHFGVSHVSMLVRLRQLGCITSDQFSLLKPDVVSEARRLGYSLELYRPTNSDKVLSRYAEKARYALERGIISEGRYEEMLMEAGLTDILFGSEEAESGNEEV